MKKVNTKDAVGMILCHDITEIVPGVKKGTAFKKGHVIREEDIEHLLDLGKYNIENLLLYKTYSNPKTSYSGLFLYVTKDANIIQDNSTLIIILSIIGGIIFLILLIVLIIFLVRKKRKDKLEDIANA